METELLKRDLTRIYQRALDAVDPETAVLHYLDENPIAFERYHKVLLAGIGKAGLPMARALETRLGHHLGSGQIIVKQGHGGSLEGTEVFEAAHPEPDRRGVEAAKKMTGFLSQELTDKDLLIMLISGGGSALFPLPVSEIDLSDKQETTATLIRCGATIQEMNTIRKHLSQVKGGRFLDFVNGAQVLALILSDVVGDDLASIASGPTAPDPTTFSDCVRIIRKYGIRDSIPPRVLRYLESGASSDPNAPSETPKPGDQRFSRVTNVLIANNFQSLSAAAQAAQDLGYRPLILSSSIEGNTTDIAKVHVAIAREVLSSGHPIARPCCIISGGETTVLVRGSGKGGRNLQFVLQCSREISHWTEDTVLFASLGSDGNDGPTDAAGATASIDTVRKARRLGLDIRDFLERNDSYNFFLQTGDLIKTGPTRTNVMDLRFVLIR